jgi:hypothetical protein
MPAELAVYALDVLLQAVDGRFHGGHTVQVFLMFA